MPLRYAPAGAAVSAQLAAWRCRPQQRFFHTSAPRRLETTGRSNNTNHYETLNVHPNASAAEIKKSFYHLSKRHHPDHNPTDPHAPTRFMRISEAYATLSHADRRARYDRDVMACLHPGPRYQHHQQKGSYHSTGPAGGRPASGLSRRRGTYQGPPPSFYRSGGWGVHGAKRKQAHEESTGGGGGAAGFASGSGSGSHPSPPRPPGSSSSGSSTNNPSGHDPSSSSGMGSGTGGMGPGQSPFHHTTSSPFSSDNDVPHFDHAAHERAQRRADERRAQKRAAQAGVRLDQPQSATTMSFFAAAAILGAVLLGTFAISGGTRGGGPRGGGGGGGGGRGVDQVEKERESNRDREKDNKKGTAGK